MDESIGFWFARFSDRGARMRLTKSHLIESVISDRYVTRCGRQLGPIADTSLHIVFSPTGDETCKAGCLR